MLHKLKLLAKELCVDIVQLDELEEDGCYLPEFDIVYIRSGLTEYEKIQVLSHELSHATRHKNLYTEYIESFRTHSKAEYEAGIAAIKVSLVHYLNNNDFVDLSQTNYIHFMNCYNVDYSFEPIVKKLFPILYKKVD